ncbi:winged helix-turn-helix transcriptional regulator [Methanomassiliicoccus luminyensis]|jgi:DNA-binding HxlR family transcriptional regulator|uniref:winged helix-turn-helix transcriptional regulator n=1 Tax=Methanomassiliicoccus luminyensis TaxID=1080712 RepID=UPI00037F506E|nr:helix-turn-helix domain-containing protein [Methanomassiliicoccus luminyensis]
MERHSECAKAVKQIMDILGGKWSFVIMGELHSGPKRFNELSKTLGISTKSLSDALKSLESNGIVIRIVHPTSPIRVEYGLTEKGRDFEQVFFAMVKWGMKWLKEDEK